MLLLGAFVQKAALELLDGHKRSSHTLAFGDEHWFIGLFEIREDLSEAIADSERVYRLHMTILYTQGVDIKCRVSRSRPRLETTVITVHNYNMQNTKHRTSFALDEQTIDRLKALARSWNVSQAEVVRRAVSLAYRHSESEAADVRERVAEYRAAGRIAAGDADDYLRRLRAERDHWRGEP